MIKLLQREKDKIKGKGDPKKDTPPPH